MYYEDNRYNNSPYYQPPFADRTPRRSYNMIARPNNLADRCMNTMGVNRSATGRYQMPVRERRGFIGVLATVLTFAVVAPIAITSKVINGVKDAFDDKDYDDDDFYERDYPAQMYQQKQNTRTRVYDENGVKHTYAEDRPKKQNKLVATANVKFDNKKQEILEKTRQKIRGSVGRPDLDEMFSQEVIKETEYATYSLGDNIRKNVSYELSTDKNFLLDLVNLASRAMSTLELREHCGDISVSAGKTESEKFIFLFDKTSNKHIIYKGSMFSNNFVKITYNVEVYKDNIKIDVDATLEGDFKALKTSKLYVQVPSGYQIKLKFLVS